MESRKDHLDWCKTRALEFLDRSNQYYDPKHAFSSMMSDMRKHEETAKTINSDATQVVVLATMATGLTHDAVKKFVEGFN